MNENQVSYIAFNPQSGALLAWGKSPFHAVQAADQNAPTEPIRVFRAGNLGTLIGHGRLVGELSSEDLGALLALEAALKHWLRSGPEQAPQALIDCSFCTPIGSFCVPVDIH